jgi:signal peptidase
MRILNAVKKTAKITGNILFALILIFVALLISVRLLGIQVYSVISGSMEPEYPVGSLIYVKKADPSDISVGDVITFVLPSNTPATHRVVRIDEQNRCFYTKGDANEAEDGSPVDFRNLIGTPVFKIPYLGYLIYSVQHPPGLYIFISAGAVLLLIVFLPDLFKKSKHKPLKQSGEGITQR